MQNSAFAHIVQSMNPLGKKESKPKQRISFSMKKESSSQTSSFQSVYLFNDNNFESKFILIYSLQFILSNVQI